MQYQQLDRHQTINSENEPEQESNKSGRLSIIFASTEQFGLDIKRKYPCMARANKVMKKMSLYAQSNGIFHKGEMFYHSTTAFVASLSLILGVVLLLITKLAKLNSIVALNEYS